MSGSSEMDSARATARPTESTCSTEPKTRYRPTHSGSYLALKRHSDSICIELESLLHSHRSARWPRPSPDSPASTARMVAKLRHRAVMPRSRRCSMVETIKKSMSPLGCSPWSLRIRSRE